jgi:hypothetical protein
MTIELSNIIFTDQDDVVPQSGIEQIVNTGIANALGGNDVITGTGVYGFENFGSAIFNTDDGNDTITGSGIIDGITIASGSTFDTGKGDDIIIGNASSEFGLRNSGTLTTDNGNDIITGTGGLYGISTNPDSTLDTGEGNDIITGIGRSSLGILNFGTINTGNAEDSIVAQGGLLNISRMFLGDGNDSLDITLDYSNTPFRTVAFRNYGVIETGDGNDIISTNNVIHNRGIINTGNGEDSIIIVDNFGFYYNIDNDDGIIDTSNGNDSIIADGGFNGRPGSNISNTGTITTGNGEDFLIISNGIFTNRGNVFLGEGNDSITANVDLPNRAIENFNFIGTGDGNDVITSNGVIYNEGVIETGNGDDSIIVDAGMDDLTGTSYGIYNNGGAINMGDGNDSIIANQGFESGPNSSGTWFLGEDDDYIKGYGSGDFYGGNGNDTLELTPGTYTVGIWGEGGESPIFTKGDQLMITSEFEKLKAGSTIYDFTSLTAGQIIVVA